MKTAGENNNQTNKEGAGTVLNGTEKARPELHKIPMNRIFFKKFSSFGESVCSKLNFSEHLHIPRRFIAYITEITGTTEALLGEGSINGVILFGSAAYDRISPSSDVDLIIIINDDIDRHRIREIEPYLKALEVKYGFSRYPSNIIEHILEGINHTTGMFCSHFIVRRSDWCNNKFNKIFNAFPPFSFLLAPDKIVLDSVRAGAYLLYGDASLLKVQSEFRGKDKKPYPKTQIIKSLIMTTVLFIGGLTMAPFDGSNVKYMLESFKWAARTLFFVIFSSVSKLSSISIIGPKLGIPVKFLRRIEYARKLHKQPLKFYLTIPFYIFKIHKYLLGTRLPNND